MKKFFKFGCLGFIAIIVIIVIIAIASGDDDTAQTPSNDSTSSEETNTEGTQEEQPAAEEESKEDDGKIKAGTYKIGTDLPAGEYLVVSTSVAYIESAKDSTGQLDSIIFNDNLTNGANSYVTLNDGEYFKLQGGEMYPVASAPSIIPENGLYKNGMYKVGKDIPAGEYKVVLDSAIGIGYLEVSSNSSRQLDSIVTNENVQANMYITVSDGQYLKLQDVTIQK